MLLRYVYRLDPSPAQRETLAQAFGCARLVYNEALAARQAAYEAGDPWIGDAELSSRIKEMTKDPGRPWLGEVSVVVLHQALRDLTGAYRNFFASLKGERKGQKIGPPRFRSRKDARQSVRFTRSARFHVLPDGTLRLPKIGNVKVCWSRQLPAEPSSVTVLKDAAGRYFASFVVNVAPQPLPEVDAHCGIDLGLNHFAVLDDGTKVTSPRFLRRAEKRLRKLGKSMSRKQQGSKNWDKARAKVARAHAKVADARRDFHHQVSTEIIRENQAVYVEDLVVRGMARGRLAKSVYDVGWSSFVHMLEYKAALYGRQFCKIGRFEPTSRMCSACGVKGGRKPLWIREWTCPECGAFHDRDVNAAKNILAAGRAESQNACGGDVRPGATPADASEARSHRSRARQRTALQAEPAPYGASVRQRTAL